MVLLSLKTSVSHPWYLAPKPLVYLLTHCNVFPRLTSVYSQCLAIFVSKGLWCLDVCCVATLLLMWQCSLVTPDCGGGGVHNVWLNQCSTSQTSSSLHLADDWGQIVPSAAAGRQEAGAAGSGIDESDFILGPVASNPRRLYARRKVVGNVCMALCCSFLVMTDLD